MKVTPEKFGITMPMTDEDREWSQVRADEWRVEFTDGFQSLVKAMEDSWPLT